MGAFPPQAVIQSELVVSPPVQETFSASAKMHGILQAETAVSIDQFPAF
jgi:hypothetical protein